MKARLLALGFVLVAAPSFAQNISISSFERSTIASFGALSVNGAGFDPANGAISLIVIPRGGVAVTIPVYSASSSNVKAIVPPLINSTNGELFDTPIVADVQAVQMTRSTLSTSNTLGSLTINPPPQAPGAVGTATIAFLKTMLDVNTDLRAGLRNSAALAPLVAKSNEMTASTNQLIDAAKLVAGGADRTASLTSTDGQPLGMSQKALRISDRLVVAYVQQTVERASTAGAVVSGPMDEVPGGCNGNSYTGDAQIDRLFSDFRKNPCNAYSVAQKVVPAAAAGVYGAELGFLAGWAAGGLASAGVVAEEAATALGWLTGQAINYAAATFAGTDPPTIMSTARDAGATVLDTIKARGLPIFSGLNTGIGLGEIIESAVTQAKGPNTNAPQGGVMVAAPPAAPPGGVVANVTRTVLGFVTQPAAPPTVQTVAVSSAPSTQPLTLVTLPAPTAARFNGTYSGSTAGSCSVTTPDGVFTSGGSGPLNFTVLNGVISDGGGTVSSNGVVTSNAVVAGAASCSWGGRFWEDGTNAGVSGWLGCSAPFTVCSFSWSAARTSK